MTNDDRDDLGVRLSGEFDASVWAREWNKMFPVHRPSEETMVGWFANAIMSGFDYARNHPKELNSTVIISPTALDDLAIATEAAPHDNKGFSEEKCLRCGWVMGHLPLNCNNDDTPHVFPSQLPSEAPDGAFASREMKPFAFSYHRPDGGYTEDPDESTGHLPLEEAVFQALGYASMCWSETPTGVFDSTAAKSAGDALIAFIEDMM